MLDINFQIGLAFVTVVIYLMSFGIDENLYSQNKYYDVILPCNKFIKFYWLLCLSSLIITHWYTGLDKSIF